MAYCVRSSSNSGSCCISTVCYRSTLWAEDRMDQSTGSAGPTFTDSYSIYIFVVYCLTFQTPYLNVDALYGLIYFGKDSVLGTNDDHLWDILIIYLLSAPKVMGRWKMSFSDFWLKWFVNWIFRLRLRQIANLFLWIAKHFRWMKFRHAKDSHSWASVMAETICFPHKTSHGGYSLKQVICIQISDIV